MTNNCFAMYTSNMNKTFCQDKLFYRPHKSAVPPNSLVYKSARYSDDGERMEKIHSLGWLFFYYTR